MASQGGHEPARVSYEAFAAETHRGIASLARSLQHGLRIELLLLLAQRPHFEGELVKITGLSQSNVSHHLTKLCAAGLLEPWPEGRNRFFKLAQGVNVGAEGGTLTVFVRRGGAEIAVSITIGTAPGGTPGPVREVKPRAPRHAERRPPNPDRPV